MADSVKNSVDFANDLSAEYVRLRDEAAAAERSLLESRVRARTIANVRQKWLRTRQDGDMTGLHTIAAFELFGFG